eukprot:14395345-Ditylum_brightwellii.AAC.1
MESRLAKDNEDTENNCLMLEYNKMQSNANAPQVQKTVLSPHTHTHTQHTTQAYNKPLSKAQV